jgi:hypothetical protein
MKRMTLLGAAILSGAVLAACGSTSQATTPLKSPTKTVTPTSQYLPIYKGIPDTPVASNGYPFSVPDDLRILAPKVLKKDILDTKLAKINGMYIGTTWTPSQRMEIYSAKLYTLYGAVFGLSQYLTTTGTYGTTNKIAMADIAQVVEPLYGSLAAADSQLGQLSPHDGLSLFRADVKGTTWTGVNSVLSPFLNTTDISVNTYQGSPEVTITVPKGAYLITGSQGGKVLGTGGNEVPVVQTTYLKDEASERSHVWVVTNSSLVNS